MQMSDSEITRIATTYMGQPAPVTVLLAIGAVATFILLFTLTVTGQVPLWFSFPIASYMVYATYTPLHEAVHNNIAGNRRDLHWLNELTGYLVASLLGVSYTMHKVAHMTHHRHTNQRGDDPDLVYTGNQLYDLFTGGPKMLMNEYRDYFSRIFPKAGSREKFTIALELAFTMSWRLVLLWFFPVETLMLGILANVVGIMILGYIFAWIVHTPFKETGRFKDTATVLMPAPLHRPVTMPWLWQNYHSIHHLFPRVPFFQYAKLVDEIRPGMEERGAPVMHLGISGLTPAST